MSGRLAYIILAVLSAILVLMLGFLWWLNRQTAILTQTPTPTETSALPQPTPLPAPVALVNLEPVLTKTGNSQELQFFLTPQRPSENLSTVALQITLNSKSGKLSSSATAPQLAQDFTGPGWTYPFKSVAQNPDSSLTIKLSVVYATPDPYVLNQEKLFFSLPLKLTAKEAADLTITIDPQVSKAFTKQNELLGFTQAGQPIAVHAQ